MSSSQSGARGQWSDGETRALIRAWGPLQLGRDGGSLDAAEWRQVCSAVNAHRTDAGLRFNRSLAQCQKKVYTLKDQYGKELAKGLPTPGWRHFAQLRPFLSGPGGPPPGFADKTPLAPVKEEEMAEEASGWGGRRRRTVPAKRPFSNHQDGSAGPSRMPVTATVKEEASGSAGRRSVPAKCYFSGFHDPSPGPSRMTASATYNDGVEEEEGEGEEEEVKEQVGTLCPASRGCSPAGVVMTLAQVYERVQMERLSVEKMKMVMEREKSLGGTWQAGDIDGN